MNSGESCNLWTGIVCSWNVKPRCVLFCFLNLFDGNSFQEKGGKEGEEKKPGEGDGEGDGEDEELEDEEEEIGDDDYGQVH